MSASFRSPLRTTPGNGRARLDWRIRWLPRFWRPRKAGFFDWFAAGMTAGRTVEDGPGASRVRIDDLRFGIPGAPADTGLWGIEAPVRSEPAAAPAVGPVGPVSGARPDLGSGAAGWLWRALTAGFAHAGPPPAPADHTGTVGASARTSGPS